MANNNKQEHFSTSMDNSAEPVECLGMTFPNDEARRAYFTERLREKLKDPAFRKIEGFPIGEDEDILALSDPPYYTACPNPFIKDFLNHVEAHRSTQPHSYHREPFATDVSEGKNDPIYTLHSYHTKVPHKAVMRHILHYTRPGDVILDGFCGTGMVGVAAQLCSDPTSLKDLGYNVTKNGDVLDQSGNAFSQVGPRFSILADLSPFASFVAAGYNNFSSVRTNAVKLTAFVHGLHTAHSSLYSTKPSPVTTVEADYYVWSEHFACPHCGHEGSLFAFAVDKTSKALKSSFPCLGCASQLSKDELTRIWSNVLDLDGRHHLKEAKVSIAEVVSTLNKRTVRYPPTSFDLDVIHQITLDSYSWVPNAEFPHGRQTRKVKTGSGISKVHQMFTPRELLILSKAWEEILSLDSCARRPALFLLTSCLILLSRRERYRDGTGKGAQSGTLYVPSLQIEKNAFDVLNRKLDAFSRTLLGTVATRSCVSTQSHTDLSLIPANSVDFIFTDPPFGESLQYGELNFFHEAWFKVHTNIKEDCVLNYVHNKDMAFYQRAMERAFLEAFRVLKPGRWIAVEFHNSQNNIWMAIQQALWQAGFAVADVRILDKQQSGYNVVNREGAVDKDLLISSYKPTGEIIKQFEVHGGTEKGMWVFLENHLQQLPVVVRKKQGSALETIAERQKHLLFDRMVAFHVQRNVSPPLSASEFYCGLEQRFPQREEMFFLPSQVTDYDKARQEVETVEQLELFVSDERSAIQWVRQQLRDAPKSYRDLTPLYMKETQKVWEKHEQPVELKTILEQNFVEDGSGRWCVPDLKNQAHLEQLRHQALVKEFQQYLDTKGRLKIVRTEALRAGFKEAWQKKDYTTIVQMAKRVPDAVIQEDQALLMYFDNASLMLGE